MPSPYSAATASTTTALAYANLRHLAELCDGSLLMTYQASITQYKLVQITNPNGASPTFTTLAQTFSMTGADNMSADLCVVNNSTTTSDVWLCWTDNGNGTGLFVAHATYTASGSSWSWDNTSTSIALGAYTGGFMLPSITYTGTTLIVACRANNSNYDIASAYTTTKNGASGWTSLAVIVSIGSTSHAYPQLLHDATTGCTILLHTEPGDTLYAQVCSDSNTPTLANWSTKVALSGTINVGAANFSGVLDPANARLHVAYHDANSSTNPFYNHATYTTSSVSAGTAFSVDSGVTTATGATIALDGASTPNAWVFWATGAIGAASDIEYAKVASPYTAAGATTNLTNNTAHDNAYPHLPTNVLMNSFAPLIYVFGLSPWTIEYDNSVVVAGGATQGSLTAVAQSVLSASGQVVVAASNAAAVGQSVAGLGTVRLEADSVFVAPSFINGSCSASAQSAFSVSAARVVTPSAPLPAQSQLATLPAALIAQSAIVANASIIGAAPGTGIGDLVVSTQSQTWSGGPAGSPGVETDLTYTDSLGDGVAVGLIPSYGGMPIASWYEVDSNVASANQTSLTTSVPDGHIHWLYQDSIGNFFGSEDKPFTLTELAPTGTRFRRYYQCSFGPDADGLNWTGYACVYPGDPFLILYRFDVTNPSGSALALASSDSMEIALIGGMEQNDTTWDYHNGGYGTVGGVNTTPWPTASTTGNLVAADPDYVYITPSSGSGLNVGQLTVKQKATSAYNPVWANPAIAVLQNTSRMKLKIQGDLPSLAAGFTSTVYLLNVLRRNLTSGDAIAIAADYRAPGTPTVATGAFSSFSYDEGAYVFSAAGNVLNATLDLSPAHVSIRYKPRLKITGWTAGAPSLAWGGTALTAGVDYRFYVDAVNHILYLHLYYDVVSSGAAAGQRVNAALTVVGATYVFDAESTLTDAGGAKVIAAAGALASAGNSGFSASATIIAVTPTAAPAQSVASVGVEQIVAPATAEPLVALSAFGAGAAVVAPAGAAPFVASSVVVVPDEQVETSAALVGNSAFLVTGVVLIAPVTSDPVVANASASVPIAAVEPSAAALVGNAVMTELAGITALLVANSAVTLSVTIVEPVADVVAASAVALSDVAVIASAPVGIAASSAFTLTGVTIISNTVASLASNTTTTVAPVTLTTTVAPLAAQAVVSETSVALVATQDAVVANAATALAPVQLEARVALAADASITVNVTSGAQAQLAGSSALVVSGATVIAQTGALPIAGNAVATTGQTVMIAQTGALPIAGNATLTDSVTLQTHTAQASAQSVFLVVGVVIMNDLAVVDAESVFAPTATIETFNTPLVGASATSARAALTTPTAPLPAQAAFSAPIAQVAPAADAFVAQSVLTTANTTTPATADLAAGSVFTISGVVVLAAQTALVATVVCPPPPAAVIVNAPVGVSAQAALTVAAAAVNAAVARLEADSIGAVEGVVTIIATDDALVANATVFITPPFSASIDIGVLTSRSGHVTLISH